MFSARFGPCRPSCLPRLHRNTLPQRLRGGQLCLPQCMKPGAAALDLLLVMNCKNTTFPPKYGEFIDLLTNRSPFFMPSVAYTKRSAAACTICRTHIHHMLHAPRATAARHGQAFVRPGAGPLRSATGTKSRHCFTFSKNISIFASAWAHAHKSHKPPCTATH